MRRPELELQSLIDKKLRSPISPADGPGVLYIFEDRRSLFKIGRTINYSRRQRQWSSSCFRRQRRWHGFIQCTTTHRAGALLLLLFHEWFSHLGSEALSHLFLEKICVDRPRRRCRTCKWFNFVVRVFVWANIGFKKHRELFQIEGDRTSAVGLIKDALKLAATL